MWPCQYPLSLFFNSIFPRCLQKKTTMDFSDDCHPLVINYGDHLARRLEVLSCANGTHLEFKLQKFRDTWESANPGGGDSIDWTHSASSSDRPPSASSPVIRGCSNDGPPSASSNDRRPPSASSNDRRPPSESSNDRRPPPESSNDWRPPSASRMTGGRRRHP